MYKAILLVFIAIGLYLFGLFSANNDLFPYWIKDIWWFDEVGHFFIFGLLAFSLGVLFQMKSPWWRWSYIVVGVFELFDEFAQLLNSHRTFSILDISISLLGVVCFYLLHILLIKKKIL